MPSIKQLYRASAPYSRNGAADVDLTSVKSVTTKGGFPAVKCKAHTVSSRRKRKHDTWFVGKEQNKLLHKQKNVLAQCSCENYMYTWEYANAQHGAARIIYSNGDPAVVVNPNNQEGLCRHLCRLAEEIFRQKL